MSEIKKENILIYEEGVPSNDNNSSTPSEEKPYQRFLKRIQVKGGEDGQPWSNPDLVPTPIEDQNWKPYAYLAYWISDSYNAAGWRTAGSFITKGLSPGWTYGCNVLGHVVIAFIVAIHGLFGSKYHVPFTVQSRAAFGFYFSHVIVFMRFIVGCYYYGINAYTGAECVQAMIYAMSPRFKHMKNTIHDGSTTSSMLLCYFIYTVICLPFHYIHAKNIRKFLMFKAIVCPITGIAMMIWLNTKAGGTSIIWNQGSKAKGSKLSWLIVQCVTTSAASYSTLGVNVNDFTRYAANYHAPYAQLYAIPLIHGIMTPMGIVGSVATELIYGRAIWDPLLIAEEWIGTPRGRVAAFFVALSFLIAQIGINISANSISAANDLTALFPKYVNIRRGQFIIVLLGGWALCPWEVIANATTLTAFMGGYSIFLGPIAAVLMCDYFIVHRQKYDYEEFYNPNGIYRYGTRLGTNWRTIPPLLVGFVPLLPGLASYINKSIKLPQGVLNLYLVGYFYSFPVAFLTYYVVCLLFPPQSTMIEKAIIPPSRERNVLSESDLQKPKVYQVTKKFIKDVVL